MNCGGLKGIHFAPKERTGVMDIEFYKDCALTGLKKASYDSNSSVRGVMCARDHSMNLKTYLSSKAMSNFRNNAKYSFLNDRFE